MIGKAARGKLLGYLFLGAVLAWALGACGDTVEPPADFATVHLRAETTADFGVGTWAVRAWHGSFQGQFQGEWTGSTNDGGSFDTTFPVKPGWTVVEVAMTAVDGTFWGATTAEQECVGTCEFNLRIARGNGPPGQTADATVNVALNDYPTVTVTHYPDSVRPEGEAVDYTITWSDVQGDHPVYFAGGEGFDGMTSLSVSDPLLVPINYPAAPIQPDLFPVTYRSYVYATEQEDPDGKGRMITIEMTYRALGEDGQIVIDSTTAIAGFATLSPTGRSVIAIHEWIDGTRNFTIMGDEDDDGVFGETLLEQVYSYPDVYASGVGRDTDNGTVVFWIDDEGDGKIDRGQMWDVNTGKYLYQVALPDRS